MASLGKLVDKATSSENLEPDWETIMTICDKIRGKEVTFKKVLPLLKKKLHDRNPHVQHFALMVLEACMKNCGASVHDEVAAKSFMDELHELLKSGVPPLVKGKLLELVQAWKHAFRDESRYAIVGETFNRMQLEGFEFPPLVDTTAMFMSEKPPEWVDDKDASNCHLCRSSFGLMNRIHHCRNCGQVFCHDCSSKKAAIPKYGYEVAVRVCDTCNYKLEGKTPSAPSGPGAAGAAGATGGAPGQGGADLPLEYLQSNLAKESQTPPSRNPARERELQEEEELQIAMAMSLNEEDNKKQQQPKKQKASRSSSGGSGGSSSRSSAVSTSASPSPAYASSTSSSSGSRSHPTPAVPMYQPAPTAPQPVASAAAPYYSSPGADRWQQPAAQYDPGYQQPAPPVHAPVAAAPVPAMVAGPSNNDGTQDLSVLKSSLHNSIGMFVDRMQAVSAQGRSIALDASVQSLFQSLSAMHPPLLAAMEEVDEEKAHYVELEKKLKDAKEARVSLNAMRRTHAEKVKQQQSELEMLARIQMQQKLELLRQQKSEQLEHMEELRRQRQGDLQKQLQQQQQYEVLQQTEAQQALVFQQQQLLQEQQAQIQAMSAAITHNDPQLPPQGAAAVSSYQPGMLPPAHYEAAPAQSVHPPPQQYQPQAYAQQPPPEQAGFQPQMQQQLPPQQAPSMQQYAPQHQQPPQHHQPPPQQQPPPPQQQPPPPQQQTPPQQPMSQQYQPQHQLQQPAYQPSALPPPQHQQQQPQFAAQQPGMQQMAPTMATGQYGAPAGYGYEGNVMPAAAGVPDQQLISFD